VAAKIPEKFRDLLTTKKAFAQLATVSSNGQPQVTPVGLRHPVTADLLPQGQDKPSWGRWFREMPASSSRGVTVMSGVDGLPLLILDRVGKGRVAQLFSDQLWMWSKGFEGGGPHAELIRRIGHWLMQEPDLAASELCWLAANHILDLVAVTIGATQDATEVAAGSGIRAARLRAIKADIESNFADGDVGADALAGRHGVDCGRSEYHKRHLLI